MRSGIVLPLSSYRFINGQHMSSLMLNLFYLLVRGNSKYHYYGLRIKAGSSLLRLMEDQQHLAMRQQPFSQKQRYPHSPPFHICCLSSRLLKKH